MNHRPWWIALVAACDLCPSDSGTCPGDVDTVSDSDRDTDPVEVDTDATATDSDVTPGCDPAAAEDFDADGASGLDGDCDDCDPLVGPGAFEVQGNGVDDDCSGVADDVAGPCDAGIALGATDPVDAAHAIGLCADGTGGRWGLLQASWITPDGQPLANVSGGDIGHGVHASFGTSFRPAEGARMLSLSTGTARAATDPAFQDPLLGFDKGYETSTPMGYPVEISGCPGVLHGPARDGIGLAVKLRTPTNARSLHLELAWFTAGFGLFSCSAYSDFALVTMSPAPAGVGIGGNVAFDARLDSLNPDSPLLRACVEQDAASVHFDCPLGTGSLVGTGFDPYGYDVPFLGGAGTGWLALDVPIEVPGGQIELRFPIWDSGDGIQDSTLLIDNLRFGTEVVPLGPLTPL